MDTEDDGILHWAKAHKKAIVKEYLGKYDYPTSEHPNVIFMAGAPGAGKTEFALSLIPQLTSPPLNIDMDEIAQHIQNYKPRIAHLFRAGATVILERMYDQAVKKKIDILMDGTFSHPKAVQNVDRAIEHGYSVRIYFIAPDPMTAWIKTRERALVEERTISAQGFVKAYFDLLENLRAIYKKYGPLVPVSVVLKDKDNRLREIIENIANVENYLEPALTATELLDKISV